MRTRIRRVAPKEKPARGGSGRRRPVWGQKRASERITHLGVHGSRPKRKFFEARRGARGEPTKSPACRSRRQRGASLADAPASEEPRPMRLNRSDSEDHHAPEPACGALTCDSCTGRGPRSGRAAPKEKPARSGSGRRRPTWGQNGASERITRIRANGSRPTQKFFEEARVAILSWA